MYRKVLAFDFDGTVAVDGVVPPDVEAALEQCRLTGHALFLVTGRRFETVSLGSLAELFTGIVWENGAVLFHTASGELYFPFGQLPPHVVDGLAGAGIPMERGMAIAATWLPHDQAVWEVLRASGGGASVDYNKGAVMIAPMGTSKGAGLERLLTICGLSPRNVAAFGDAENDLSMLKLAEVAVAVSDAVPAVRDMADVVAAEPGPRGVLEILRQYPLGERYCDVPLHHERPIALGQSAEGTHVALPASRLAGRNLGVFGDSGTGKSWMVGLLAEGLHHEHYQVLLIDPEGDFGVLRALPQFVVLEGDRASLPAPSAVVSLLDAAAVSVVLDLSRYPPHLRASYVAELLRTLRPLRHRKYRPHWIVIEEAQQFLLPDGEVTTAVLPWLKDGGWAFVSYRPDRMDAAVLDGLHHVLLTRLTESESLRALQAHCKECGIDDAKAMALPPGNALLCGGTVAQLRPAMRRVPHVRHLYKYLDAPLPPGKRFWFRDERGGVGAEAASLFEFLELIPTLPIHSIEYHDRRQDFMRWAEHTLGDAALAARLRKLSNRQLSGHELREALRNTLSVHYADWEARR
jgi:hypothetical protein